VFRAYRYGLDVGRFHDRDLDPGRYAQLNAMIREGRVPDDYHGV
jgi:hypothetical protein